MRKEIQEMTADVNVHHCFDFKQTAFSTLEIELDGNFAENTEIVIGEIARDGAIVHEPGFTTFIQWVMKLKNGHHIYRFPIPEWIPAYEGFPHCNTPAEADGEVAPFRYVEINRYYGKATVRRTAWFGDGDDTAASFVCSDPVLNKIWDFCKYSIKATSLFNCYIDGERERMPYEADAYINQLSHFVCDKEYTIARNTIDHFIRHANYTWPTEWLLLTPLLVEDYLMYSGDRDSFQRWLPELDSKLLARFMNKDHLLAPAQFEQTFDPSPEHFHARIRDIVDWPLPERNGYDLGEVNFVPNALLVLSLQAMYRLTNDISYLRRAKELKHAIRQKFLLDGRFVDSVGSTHTALHTAVMAIYAGLAEGDEIRHHKDMIVERDMACSVYFAQYLLDCCFANGLTDHALKLITGASPRSWQNMLRKGATITRETWGYERYTCQDWNHAWGTAPANVITRRICGIRPTVPGFERFTIDPHPGELTGFRCVQPTIHGPIELEYDHQTGYKLSYPAGTVYDPGKTNLPLKAEQK